MGKKAWGLVGLRLGHRARLGHGWIMSSSETFPSYWQSFHPRVATAQQLTSWPVSWPVICRARPYIVECKMTHHLNTIQDPVLFKSQLTEFMLSIPDMPPIREYTPPNSNSAAVLKNERGYTSLWGGHTI